MIRKIFPMIIIFMLFSGLPGCKTRKENTSSVLSRISSDSVTSKSIQDNTLHQAALNGNLKGVLEFIAQGIDVDTKGPDVCCF